MKVEEVYYIYRVVKSLGKAVEEYDEPELRKRARVAVRILEQIAFRLRISDELWSQLEGKHEPNK